MMMPMSFRQITFLKMLKVTPLIFNANLSVWRDVTSQPESVETVREGLTLKHEALRLVLSDGYYQSESANSDDWLTLSKHTSDDSALHHTVEYWTQLPLISGSEFIGRPLSRLVVVQAGSKLLMGLVISHLVSDAISIRFLADDIDRLLKGELDGNHSERSRRYTEFVRYEEEWIRSEAARTRAQFWFDCLANLPKYLNGVSASAPGAVMPLGATFAGDDFSALTAALRARRHTLLTAVFASYALGISALVGHNDVVVRTMSSNRKVADFQRTVGYFATPVAVRINIPSAAELDDALRITSRSVTEAMRHADTFQVWNKEPGLGSTTFFKVLFRGGRHGMVAERPRGPMRRDGQRNYSARSTPSTASGLLLVVYESDHELQLQLAFAPEQISRENAALVFETLCTALHLIASS